jgi:hypothetical protein
LSGGERDPGPGIHGAPQPDYWLAEYTTELLNVLNVLGWLADLEPQQAKLLEKICSGPTISAQELSAAGARTVPAKPKKKSKMQGPDLFGNED